MSNAGNGAARAAFAPNNLPTDHPAAPSRPRPPPKPPIRNKSRRRRDIQLIPPIEAPKASINRYAAPPPSASSLTRGASLVRPKNKYPRAATNGSAKIDKAQIQTAAVVNSLRCPRSQRARVLQSTYSNNG